MGLRPTSQTIRTPGPKIRAHERTHRTRVRRAGLSEQPTAGHAEIRCEGPSALATMGSGRVGSGDDSHTCTSRHRAWEPTRPDN